MRSNWWRLAPLAALILAGSLGCSGNETGVPAGTVQLAEGMVLGKSYFTNAEIQPTGTPPSLPTIDGLGCNLEQRTYHIHAHLSLFDNGQQIAIPLGIGTYKPDVQNGFVDFASCFYTLHTHDASGIIHVESAAPGTYTLGQFFDIWGQPLVGGSSPNVANFQGPLVVYVNGQLYTGDPRAITLTPFELITLEVGTPLVTPPNYFFPQSYYR